MMEQRYRTVDTRAFLDEFRTLLPEAGILPLRVSGNSMYPFLVHGRDTVYLSDAREGVLRRGDIVLFQRDDGDYILHRIIRVGKDGTCRVTGDAQTALETVRRNQIFAVVRRAERNGKKQTPGTACWVFFEKIWVHLVPLRPFFLRLYSRLHSVCARRNGKNRKKA